MLSWFKHIKRGAQTLLRILGIAMMSLIAISCAAPTPAPAPTSGAPQPPAPAATATSAGPRRGGRVTMAMWQSPTTLNGMLNTQTVITEVRDFFAEGLTTVIPDGTRVPLLAKEVPSVQNGGVNADGKTITYKLKDGIVWSDGQPFTCEDVKFTWQARMTPGVGVTSTTGYRDIDTVECPDPLTAVIKFKNFYAPYLTLFDFPA